MKKFSLIFICFLFTSFNFHYSQIQLKRSTMRPYLKVTAPNGGEKYTKGEYIAIRWKSNLIHGNVKIKLKWGTGGGGWFVITDNTANSGKYKYDIPVKGIGRHGDQFRIFVMTLDEKIQDASDSMFTIINKQPVPKVDLTCSVYSTCRKWGTDKLIISIKVLNKGTRTLHDVLFNYVILQAGTMVKQDGAGFGVMYPGVWYKAKYEFNPEDILSSKHRGYSVKLFVDPDNKQLEPQHLRGDNTATRSSSCIKK